ncbi:DUF6286 domain-containing protein [Arthrobacter sp. NicSoilC12]|uniref:DUF6286 domain-containing protein n=1 Tax=Arthrobacter sp. NicSoilC12 TaxID=2831001 RepID=UPI001CC4A25B|nr:DUF6286 domain-containing protein [Arthrobacter sp. NicSoilC12]GIU55896.1 hypothetical protein NicSoilC12_16450 [Arthrobacter sp. NicSoilC12]
MSQDTQNAGIDSAGQDADAVQGRAPLGSGAAGMGRIVKRETHTSRAVVSVIAAGLVMAVFGYALLETGVRAIGQPPWLVDPQTAAERVVALPAGIPPLLLGVTGAVIAMAGLFFFLNAVLPGRRARHLLPDRRAAVVVDDEVIAAALARRARLAANVAKEQVMVVVSRNRITVNVRPTSGVPLHPDAVLEAVRREVKEMGPWPMPEVRIQVSTAGVVGA